MGKFGTNDNGQGLVRVRAAPSEVKGAGIRRPPAFWAGGAVIVSSELALRRQAADNVTRQPKLEASEQDSCHVSSVVRSWRKEVVSSRMVFVLDRCRRDVSRPKTAIVHFRVCSQSAIMVLLFLR